MNAERKAQWVAALRSGQYKQAHGALTRIAEDGTLSHCCLGVACQVLGIESKPAVVSQLLAYGSSGDTTTMPSVASEELGVSTGNPCIIFDEPLPNGTRTASLASLNDDYRLTLPQIADLIEYFL